MRKWMSLFLRKNNILILFKIGGQKGHPPTSVSPVTSTNVEISPKNFVNFSFNPFATLV